MARARFAGPLVLGLAVAVTPLAPASPDAAAAELGAAEATSARPSMVQQLYANGIARLSKGDPAGAIPALDIVSEVAPEVAEAQYALALAQLLADFGHRDGALAPAHRALAAEPQNPLFAIVAILADPAQCRLAADGALLLSDRGAERIRAALPLLPQLHAARDASHLVPVLRAIEPSYHAAFPWRLAGFAAMLGAGAPVQLADRIEPRPLGRLFALAVPGKRFQQFEPRMIARLQGGLDRASAATLRRTRPQ